MSRRRHEPDGGPRGCLSRKPYPGGRADSEVKSRSRSLKWLDALGSFTGTPARRFVTVRSASMMPAPRLGADHWAVPSGLPARQARSLHAALTLHGILYGSPVVASVSRTRTTPFHSVLVPAVPRAPLDQRRLAPSRRPGALFHAATRWLPVFARRASALPPPHALARRPGRASERPPAPGDLAPGCSPTTLPPSFGGAAVAPYSSGI